MPLPVGHSLAGGAIYAALDADGGLSAWRRIFLAVFLANAPDLDMIPGIIVGDPNRFHHGPSHSFGMVLIVAVIAAAIALIGPRWPVRGRRRSRVITTALMVGALWSSHILLDALGQDFSEPAGVPVWWPLADRHVQWAGWFLYVDKLDGRSGPVAFVTSLLNAHNIWVATVEVLVLAPVVALIVWWRRGAGWSRRRPVPAEVISEPGGR